MVSGDIRDKAVRDALKEHAKTGHVWEDRKLGEWECQLKNGILSLGQAAFKSLEEHLNKIRKPHRN